MDNDKINKTSFLKFLIQMGGINVLTPQNVKDVKMAEIDWNENLEDRYLYIRKAMKDATDEEVETLMKRIILDYVKPTSMLELTDHMRDVQLSAAEYLQNHTEERQSSSLEDILKTIRE